MKLRSGTARSATTREAARAAVGALAPWLSPARPVPTQLDPKHELEHDHGLAN